MAPYSISFTTFLALVLIIVCFKSGHSRSLIPIEDYDPPRASHCHNNGEYWVCPPHKGEHVSNVLKHELTIKDRRVVTSEHDSSTWHPVPTWHKVPPRVPPPRVLAPPPKQE
ncbi:hypothetical protein H5410_054613 [Solanum commersonii]|uniref:Transmembrane protein n=1 Tax=Solanum commersonii TaxID=4109 RepID=A0A9J5WGJ3_SOLCO|nr:hypothetical protein H5410_054613 [Solanum commersonii]